MSFTSFSNYLFENEELGNKKVSKVGKIESIYGWIDYCYERSDEYPNGVVVDLVGYVYKQYRGKGKLKDMLKKLLSSVPPGTTVQMAVSNRHLMSMLKDWDLRKLKE